jgi:hypothetical protein
MPITFVIGIDDFTARPHGAAVLPDQKGKVGLSDAPIVLMLTKGMLN